MKKIFILFIVLFSGIGMTFADDTNKTENQPKDNTPLACQWWDSEWWKKCVKVITNSEMPWVYCVPEEGKKNRYTCYVPKDSTALIWTFWWIIKYFAFLTGIFWVLFIVINWIMYSMGWLDQELKETAKKRIIQTIFWLVILFSSGYILQTLAPWFFK